MLFADQPAQFELLLEGSAVYQVRNDVRVPSGGTTFSYKNLLGSGPKLGGRLTVLFHQSKDQGWRFVYAPLTISGSGKLTQTTEFNGSTFQAGVETDGSYRFDSYRLSYWRRTRGDWRFGYTLKVRDAEVSLRQGSIYERFKNTGLVPLIYLGGERRIDDRSRVLFDFDGLAAPQGRALDLAVFYARTVSSGAEAFVGFRALEGGADNDQTYNSALITYLSAGVAVRF